MGVCAGLPLLGCAPARVFADVLPALGRYYAEGRASGFEHAVAHERVDPFTVLPEARTMIAVALPYRTAAGQALVRPAGARGFSSRYIWGEDYHLVLRDRLNELSVRLSKAVGRQVASVVCVDTSPLLDRAVAVLAGLGWIGKNTCLITSNYGSWVFLGTLLVDVEVVASLAPEVATQGPAMAATAAPPAVAAVAAVAPLAPLALDQCRDCTLCLTACPTGALREPYILDSASCLSYVTQASGHIPAEFRKPLGRRVWGCDTCQTVCPKNHPSLLVADPRLDPDADTSYPDLIAILTMSNRAFLRRFGKTAGAWRGPAVWRRNALIALGNLRTHAALPVIIPYLTHARPELRGSAAWALRQIDELGMRSTVAEAVGREADPDVRAEMLWATE